MIDIDKRTIVVASYLIDNNSTIRKTASAFGMAKSTVHFDISHRLKKINLSLYRKAQKILETNFEQKNIRGGLATKKKYAK